MLFWLDMARIVSPPVHRVSDFGFAGLIFVISVFYLDFSWISLKLFGIHILMFFVSFPLLCNYNRVITSIYFNRSFFVLLCKKASIIPSRYYNRNCR